MVKIYLSPSDQTENKYTGVAVNEGDNCHRIAYILEDVLRHINGVEVKCNHQMAISKGIAESNAWGADYHICIHTNAYNGKVAGTRLFYGQQNGLGHQACSAIMATLSPITPGTSDNITQNKNLNEVKNIAAATVYIEIGFHDNAEEAAWMASHQEDIAKAIAVGMCNHLGITYIDPAPVNPVYTYHIHIGEQRDKATAEQIVESLRILGIASAHIEAVEVK